MGAVIGTTLSNVSDPRNAYSSVVRSVRQLVFVVGMPELTFPVHRRLSKRRDTAEEEQLELHQT
jgi:hypothetical protein